MELRVFKALPCSLLRFDLPSGLHLKAEKAARSLPMRVCILDDKDSILGTQVEGPVNGTRGKSVSYPKWSNNFNLLWYVNKSLLSSERSLNLGVGINVRPFSNTASSSGDKI